MKIKRTYYIVLLAAVLIAATACSCSSTNAQKNIEDMKFLSIDEAQEKWIELYNDSEAKIEQLYTNKNMAFLHSKTSELYAGSDDIAEYLQSKPFDLISSRVSLDTKKAYGHYYEYGYYLTAPDAKKYTYCTLWVKEKGSFKKEMEVIIKNDLSDTENTSHIPLLCDKWNEKIAKSGNIDDFFDSMYASDVFYYNSFNKQGDYGFATAKNTYRQWVGTSLRIGKPGIHRMENLQDDISLMFGNWKDNQGKGQAFTIYQKQDDGSWKILIEFD